MALRESGLERGIRGTMFQALRERRKELGTFKLRRATTGGAGGGSGASAVQMMDPRQSSSGSGSGKGNGNDNGGHRRGNGGGSGGGSGHGTGSAAVRGRFGLGHRHSHSHGHVRSMAATYPRHSAPFDLSHDTTTPAVVDRLRTDPVIANGAVTRHTATAMAGGEGRAVELI